MSSDADSSFDALKSDPADKNAFARWYRAEYPQIYLHALRVTGGNRPQAEDLCQDAFFVFVRSGVIDRMDSAGHARAYLKRVVVNKHIDEARKKKPDAAFSADAHSESTSSAQETVQADELIALLAERLKNEESQMLAMMIAGNNLTDIAHAFGISYKNAAVRTSRLRSKIRSLREIG